MTHQDMPLDVDPAPPVELVPAARRCFGDRYPAAVAYAKLLVTDGVVRGLIGPREAPRIWDRHLLNCAVIAELIEPNSRVIDVGSGAGLPGIVLAIARPDLSVVLLEPLARRSTFLAEVVTSIGLANADVVRARAEEFARSAELAEVVTARAVATLGRLATWCLPLAMVGGRLLAMKGDSAIEEVETHRTAVTKAGGGEPTVRRCGEGVIDPPTNVVEVRRVGSGPGPRSSERKRPRRY